MMARERNRNIYPGATLALLALCQPLLEQHMALHMGVELPALFAIGWWVAVSHAPALWLRRINSNGLTGLSVASVVSAMWMLPIALDAAVTSPWIGFVKVASVLGAGWLARCSMREASVAIQAFFIMSWGWMTGTVGVLYQNASERLCSTYLEGEQRLAGVCLVVLAILAVLTWMLAAFCEREVAAPTSPPAYPPCPGQR